MTAVSHRPVLPADAGRAAGATASVVDRNDGWACDRVDEVAAAVAARLVARGIRSGERVALVAPNSARAVVSMLALLHIDVSLVLLDPGRAPDDLTAALRLARVRWVVVGPGCTVGDTAGARLVELGELPFVPDAAAGPLDLTAWSARTDALVVWSSGTTSGLPTAVVRSGASLSGNTVRTQQRMRYRPDDVLLPLLPFAHQYGLSLLLLWWHVGCRLVVANPGRLDHALDVVAELGVTVVDATPSSYDSVLRILQHRSRAGTRLDAVRMWCVGGAPLGESLAARFVAATGRPLLDGYGSSETGNIALAPPEDPTLCGTPLPGVDVEVVDAAGRPVPAGNVGELVVRTADLMAGVLDADGSVRAPVGPGYRPRDIGYRDDRGRIAVLGRLHAVHRNGHTLYPAAISARAEACGTQVVVVPVDDRRGDSELVFAVHDPDGGTPAAWRRAIRPHLAGYEQPNRVVVLPAIPLNPNGKVDMAHLRTLVEMSEPTSGTVESPCTRPAGAGVPHPERIAGLRAVEAFLVSHRAEVLAVLTEVSGHRTAAGEFDTALATLRGAVAEVRAYRPAPVGRVAVFMPSNIPLYAYVLYLLVPALYAGHISFRPSSHIHAQIQRLHELLAPVHQLPVELSASTQREFVEGPAERADVVVFTGTYANAERVRGRLREDQMFLFFGQGVNPVVVSPDADLDAAVQGIVEMRMLNSGQDCFGPDVVLVDAGISDRFVTLLVKQLAELRFGATTDPDADYGPMFYRQAFGFAMNYLHENAEHIVHGAEIDVQARRMQPTVLLRELDGKANPEELFAPIFNVVRYRDHASLHRVLSSPYFEERAMGAMVYGRMPETVALLSHRHEVYQDRTMLDVESGNMPFGGRGMVANYVAVGGRRTAEPLLISKAVADHLAPADRAGRRPA